MRAVVDEARRQEAWPMFVGERDVREVQVPLSFASQLYHLRQHLDLVRERLRRRSAKSYSV